MAEVNIAVLIRESPRRSNRISELLRMSVGLTIVDGNRVSLYFLDDGTECLSPGERGDAGWKTIEKHLQTLRLLKCPFYRVRNEAEKPGPDGPYEVRQIEDSEFARRLIESDRVIG